jgi:hypothetical protein
MILSLSFGCGFAALSFPRLCVKKIPLSGRPVVQSRLFSEANELASLVLF